MAHDKTFAAGLARSLIRMVSKQTSPETSAFYHIVQSFADEYSRRGSFQPGEIVGRSLSLQDRLSSAGPFPTSCKIIRTGIKRRAIIENVRPGVVKSDEQAWIMSAGSVFDVTRDTLSIVEVNPPIAISQHALMRLYERSNFTDDDLLALLEQVTLWVVPVLRVLSDVRAELGTEVAIPFAGGLLLGTLEATPLAHDQGPTLTSVSRKGTVRDYLKPAFGRVGEGTLQVAVNTFVHDDELHSNQSRLREAFEEFDCSFRDEMNALRAGLLRGLPDEKAFTLFGGTFEVGSIPELMDLQATLTGYLSSEDWRTHAEAHRRPTRFLH